MYIVQKNIERITVKDKESADKIMYLLMVAGCSDSLTKRSIIGGQSKEKVFTVTADGTQIEVVGQNDAEITLHWLLSLGLNSVTVERSAE